MPQRPARVISRDTIELFKHSRVSARLKRRHRHYAAEKTGNNSPKPEIDTSGKQKEVARSAGNENTLHSNSCFLCLQDGANRYAVMVKFAWPGKMVTQKIKGTRRKAKGSTDTVITFKKEIEALKSDGSQAQVMEAIQNTVYQQAGRWKRWLWCYEIRSAEEVKVVTLILW